MVILPANMALEAWELTQRNRGNTAGAEMARVLREQYGDITLPDLDQVARVPRPTKALKFTSRERKTLLDDGAVIYLPTGETISGQRETGRQFWSVPNNTPRLVDFPSRRIEVAIYPDPERFFVPGSFDRNTDQQDEFIRQDVESLRERLGLRGITIWRPEASEATEIIFRHFDQTGVRLLGADYLINGYYPYIRTSTPTNESGSDLACVGYFSAGGGPNVGGWGRDESGVALGVARWVVPQGIR